VAGEGGDSGREREGERERVAAVMLDEDLAHLYGVSVKVLNQGVKRNIERFPPDFMFQLNVAELRILRSQFVTSRSWGGRRTPPYAFTEQGVAMLSSVLRSHRAVQVNIAIMRAFVGRRLGRGGRPLQDGNGHGHGNGNGDAELLTMDATRAGSGCGNVGALCYGSAR
jgi:hypothetical protein